MTPSMAFLQLISELQQGLDDYYRSQNLPTYRELTVAGEKLLTHCPVCKGTGEFTAIYHEHGDSPVESLQPCHLLQVGSRGVIGDTPMTSHPDHTLEIRSGVVRTKGPAKVTTVIECVQCKTLETLEFRLTHLGPLLAQLLLVAEGEQVDVRDAIQKMTLPKRVTGLTDEAINQRVKQGGKPQ